MFLLALHIVSIGLLIMLVWIIAHSAGRRAGERAVRRQIEREAEQGGGQGSGAS